MRYKTAAENSFARAVRILEQFVRARMREKNERRRLQIMEFNATERAVIQRFKQDVPVTAEMQVPEEDDYPYYNDEQEEDGENLETEPGA
jgi:hypothetical protein